MIEGLWDLCSRSLRNNFVTTAQGTFLAAGAHQFQTLWVRDFCYSIQGLLEIGEQDLVRRQILLALEQRSPQGLVARGFDVINPKWRVLFHCLPFPYSPKEYSAQQSLKTEHHGEHNTPALDSNLLIFLGIESWTQHTGDDFFHREHSEALNSLLKSLEPFIKDLLIHQPPFSDWQDSARRQGASFYMNLLWYKALRVSEERGLKYKGPFDSTHLQKMLWKNYFDSSIGLFRNFPHIPQYSLETQLWTIQEDLFHDQISQFQLWNNLKASQLWKTAGVPVFPSYPLKEISWTTTLVGLRHYHDGFSWSWLWAEMLKTAGTLKDNKEVEHLLQTLQEVYGSRSEVAEIYEKTKTGWTPVKRVLYRSESPFSWGAAKTLEALASLKKSPSPL